MARITTPTDDTNKPRIDRDEVIRFFKERAQKIDTLGSLRAVIYQDKHPDLAEKRNKAEKKRLFPLLDLDGTQRLLDIGCGTGRWATDLEAHCSHYHGLDFSEDLILHARDRFVRHKNIRFTVSSAESYSMDTLDETTPFDRILCCGVLIYLNDEEVLEAFACMANAAAPRCKIVLREPMAIGQRLTIKQHYSDELEQNYNAIYRTQSDLESAFLATLAKHGFTIVGSGDVYLDAQLNNRAETIQRWIVMERT